MPSDVPVNKGGQVLVLQPAAERNAQKLELLFHPTGARGQASIAATSGANDIRMKIRLSGLDGPSRRDPAKAPRRRICANGGSCGGAAPPRRARKPAADHQLEYPWFAPFLPA